MELTPVLAMVLFIAVAATQNGFPVGPDGEVITSSTHTKTTSTNPTSTNPTSNNPTSSPSNNSPGAVFSGLGSGTEPVSSGVASESVTPSASESSSKESSKPPIGAIVGGVVGGIVLLVIVGAVIFVVRMRRRKGKRLQNDMGHEQGGVLDKNLSLEDPRISGSASALATAGQGVPMMNTYDRSAGEDGERTRGDANGGAAPNERGGSRLDAPLENRTHEAVLPPAEIQSREVDEDGVSVQSFDMHGTNQESSVPRLPLYSRDSGT